MISRILQSFTRYVLIFISGLFADYLHEQGIDPTTVDGFIEWMQAGVPLVIAIGWSLFKNKKEDEKVKVLENGVLWDGPRKDNKNAKK